MTKKKSLKFPWRTLVLIATLALVGYVIYDNWGGFVTVFDNLNQANIPVLILLIPEQLFMYFACGQIFFSYLESKLHKSFRKKEKLKISTELNFVNRVVPAGSLGGLAYLTFRLKPAGVSAGQVSFLYIFRYAVTTVINYLQAFIAVLVLILLNAIPAEATWVIIIAVLLNLGVFTILGLVVFVASSKKRIRFFGKVVVGILDFIGRIITLGHKKHLIDAERIQNYLLNIHECVSTVKKDKRSLLKPAVWGLVYSLCEIGVYYIVAVSLGRPEILPVIMVGEALGSVFDGIIAYGPYELGMAGVMGLLLGGSEEMMAMSLVIVVMARALSLIFTIAVGYLPYTRAIREKND